MKLKLTIFTKGLLLICVPFLFQLLFLGLVGLMHLQSAEAGKWSFHSKQLLSQAQTVSQQLMEAQSAVRGYVLTEDQRLADAYQRSRRQTLETIQTLDVLVSDNRQQAERAATISDRALQTFVEMDNVRELVNGGEKAKAMERIQSRKGVQLMDAVQQEIAAFLQVEQQIDETRQEQLEASWGMLRLMLFSGAGASLLISMLLASLFSRHISRRLHRLADNTYRLAHKNALLPLLPGNDEIAELDQTFHDVARKLAQSEAMIRLYADIVKNIPLGLLICHMEDRDNEKSFRLSAVNPAVVQLLGIPAEQLLGQLLPVAFPKLSAATLNFYAEVVRTGEARDGGELWYEDERIGGNWWAVKAFPLPGQYLGLAIENVSRRKQVEEELNQLNKELDARVRRRTAQLVRANQELLEKNRENEAFVYSVSHDLRSPLVNLEGFSRELDLTCRELRHLVRESQLPQPVQQHMLGLLDSDMAESLRFIQSAVRRLSNIIDALLRLSRAGRVEYDWQRVNVQAIVERIVSALHNQIEERQATVEVKELPPAWGDPTAVEQVFANLIGNALHYLAPDRPGRIEVGCLSSGDEIDLGHQEAVRTYFVEDNGRGIPAAYQDKVFQSFQRLHADTAPGEGMGLTIVRRIVERHNGKIWFESKVNVGTTFYLSLPTHQRADLSSESTKSISMGR